MPIKFPRPILRTYELPDPKDIAALEAQRAHEAILEAAAEGESARRAARSELRAATRTAVQADLKA